ncbi:hypothetical protein LX99_04087 [Mucilaginibacter oryzae]|uniref:YD repeat-containing protein n=1 Tax=Mucilaginibacter oryzae TaxID=468058 RepID=A0A316H3U2_9SPHI|nr:hypothetical protein [Mucilaginibacter oryzae]PWK73703.1 hypothetical protein LX99_04087 [Mucilaginibacter oryzae]
MIYSKSSWSYTEGHENKKEKKTERQETRYVSSYNADGKKTALTETLSGERNYGVKWDFDSNGNISRYGSADKSDDIFQYESLAKYDKSGNLTEWNTHALNVHAAPNFWKYKYDHENHLIESSFYEEELLLNKTTYTYPQRDSKGNWLKRISATNTFEPMPERKYSGTTTREITYY